MVHETIHGDVVTHNLDLSFDLPAESLQKPQTQLLQQHEIVRNLQRSCSNFDLISHQPEVPTSRNDLLSVSLNGHLLPCSTENLSWKFFEEISTLDNQLRTEKTSATHIENAGQQVNTTQCPHTEAAELIEDVDSMVINLEKLLEEQREQEQEQQQHLHHSLTIANKSNGCATTYKIAVDCVPQQVQGATKDLKQQNSQSNFTSTAEATVATSNCKPHEQQEQQQEQQQQQQQQFHPKVNNNNNQQKGLIIKNCNQKNRNSKTHQQLETTCATNKQQRQINNKHTKQQKQLNDVSKKAMISIGGGDTEVGKTRTLPHASITSARSPAYADIGVIDLVGDTKATEAAGTAAARIVSNKMSATPQSFVEGIEAHLSLSGWRKKLLYTLLVLLMLLIIVNLVLTLWILKVMEFTTDGMGQLKIIPGGIQLTGQAIIMDMLRASTIRSRHGQPISIESSRNFSINTRDTNGVLENHLFLGHDKLECLSTGFYISDTKDRNLFSVNRDEVTIGAHALRIDGEGGAIFRESIQTPIVRAEPGHDLRLESPTRQLDVSAASDINLKSRAGKIVLSALENVKMSATHGELRLESSKILMPNLHTVQPPLTSSTTQHDHSHRSIFQLCACSNGKLFLAAPHSICAGDETTVCS